MLSTRETFKPGLFGIGLNIEKKLNDHYLGIEIQKLTIYTDIEPVCIKPSIINLQAVFLFHINLGRMKARWILEKLVDNYPNDLNGLADLIYVYQQMGREKDAQKYKERLESLKDEPLLKAKSILSQAHALTFDLPDDHNKNPEVLLKDSWRLLNMKGKQSTEVIKANKLVVEAYKVVKTIPETAHEKKIQSKKMAIHMFEEGIKKLEELHCPKEEIVAWKFNLAIAQRRLESWKYQGVDKNDSYSESCIKALESHSYVIENLSPVEEQEESMKRYFAKSAIIFAELYMIHKNFIDNAHLPESIRKRVQNLHVTVDAAINACPNDYTVLNRYGIYKGLMYQNIAAINVFSKSIELLPDIYCNWFSYAKRRNSYFFLYKELNRKKFHNGKINCKYYLELAFNDGQVCLQSKSTQEDMMRMAQICFERAMPDKRSCSFSCQDVNFIYDALDIMHELLSKRDATKDNKIHYFLGKYYAYISEYRKAVESLKMSLELSMWSNDNATFSTLCKILIAFYKRDKNRNLLSEFRFILKEAQKRNKNVWVTNGISIIRQLEPEMLFHLVKNMIEWDAKNCKEIIEQAMSKMPYCKTLKKQFEMKLQEGKSKECNTNGLAEIEISETSEISVYDFFVLHSEEDKEWVNCMLRPQLEDYDDEIKFRGFIPSRDFVVGEKVLSSILKGMKKSRKLLIILTPHHVNSRLFKDYLGEQAIFSSVGKKSKEKSIIPIVLEDCEIPDIFKPFTPIFFDRESNWEQLRMSLTVHMDSEVELENKCQP